MSPGAAVVQACPRLGAYCPAFIPTQARSFGFNGSLEFEEYSRNGKKTPTQPFAFPQSRLNCLFFLEELVHRSLTCSRASFLLDASVNRIHGFCAGVEEGRCPIMF